MSNDIQSAIDRARMVNIDIKKQWLVKIINFFYILKVAAKITGQIPDAGATKRPADTSSNWFYKSYIL